MTQTLVITGFAGDNVTQATMTMPQLLEAGSDTIAIGTTITFTEIKPASTILLGYYESTDLSTPSPLTPGWYRGIDSGGQPWWFNVPASGRAFGQKDLPPSAIIDSLITASPAVLADTAHGGSSTTIRLGGSSSTPPLLVTNSGGDAVQFESTGGNGHGIDLIAHNVGSGMHISGGSSGNGVTITGVGGLVIDGGTGDGVIISADGAGINIGGSIVALENDIPWNTDWDAEVQGEVQDALVANHLNQLVSASGTINNALSDATATAFKTSLAAQDLTYNDNLIVITSGALSGQCKPILTYDQTNGLVTVSEAFTDAPSDGVTFVIMATHIHPISQIQAGLATPTNITAGTITNVTNLTNAPSNGDFTSTMKASLNAATPSVTVSDKTGFALTSAYDAAKTAASQTSVNDLPTNAEFASALATLSSDIIAAINALNQSASRRVTLAVSEPFERPESGSVTYMIQARTYSADGAAVNADSTPTLTATGIVSGSLASHLSSATNPATGVYQWIYTVNSTDAIEQIKFDLSAVIATDTFTMTNFSQTADFVAATFTTADRATLDAAATAVALSSVATSIDALPNEIIQGTPITDPASPASLADWLINAALSAASAGGHAEAAKNRIGAFTITGDNTVLGFLKAALRSDVPPPSDIGGTFDPATYSTQAIRDSLVAAMGEALAAIYLDKLFAADYNPASKPGVSTALLNELIGNDGGVSQFTANALELAPPPPTAVQNADAMLDRDWTQVASTHERTVLNALRAIRNKFSTTEESGFVTVYEEDDTTVAYRKAIVTDAAADPIVEG